MKNVKKISQAALAKPGPARFVPSQKQLDALARRLMPEIKRFFADERIQQEFVKWREEHKAVQ